MTDEEWAEVRQQHQQMVDDINEPRSGMQMAVYIELTVPRLLEEIDRLRADNAALRERIEPSRRKALSILHQIYDLGIDPKNAHIAANARALLMQERG